MATANLDPQNLPPWIGIGVTIVMAAAGYGSLRTQVSSNTGTIAEVRSEIRDGQDETNRRLATIEADIKHLLERK